jgi:spermidine/putrescine transport system permease protein
VLGLVYTYFPFMVLPVYVSLERINRDLFDASGDLYASRRTTLARVVAPLAIPGIFAGTLLTFIPIVGDPVNAALLGGTHTTMIGNIVQRQFLTVTDYPVAAALAFILMTVLLVGALVYARWVGVDRMSDVSVAYSPGHTSSHGRGTGLRIYSILVYAWLYLPVVVMMAFSFNNISGRFNVSWQGFTFRWYREMLGVSGLTGALGVSLLVGVIVAIGATGIGLMLALALTRYRFRGRGLVDALVFLPMATPSIVLGSALLVVFVQINWQRGLPTIVLSHVMLTLSFVVITIKARAGGFDPSIEDAARDLGATEWTTLRKVTVPLLFPAILAAASVAFALSIDDFVTTSFVAGQTVTFPLWIYGSTRLGVPPQVNVMGTLLLLFGVGAIALSTFSRRRYD